MPIDKRKIAHLEKLARITLTPQESERFATQLDTIVALLRQLQAVDTEDTDPTCLSERDPNPSLRPDTVGECLERETILDEAPDTDGRYFRVAKILER